MSQQITINAKLDIETKQAIIEMNQRAERLAIIDAKVDQIFDKLEELIKLKTQTQPAPKPEPIPEPPTEQILFQTDFENGFGNWKDGTGRWNDNGEINSSWSEYGKYGRTTISNDLGGNMMKMETNGRTPSTWSNSFYAQNNNWQYDFAKEGETIITKLKVNIPNSIGFFFPNGEWGFFNLLQVKGVSSDNKVNSPLHCLYLESNRTDNWFSVGYMGKQWGDSSNTSFKQDKPKLIPIGKTFDLELEIYFHDGQGYYILKQDGEVIFELKNQRTFRKNSGIDRLDLGICNYHRYASTYINGVRSGNNITIYIDNVTITKKL